MSLGIGILSWGSHITLENSLASYKRNGLLDFADEIKIFFNKINDKDVLIAQRYGLEYTGAAKNIGIGKALKVLVENSHCDYFLFLENDWILIEDEEITKRRIQTAKQLLKVNLADVVRLRHRVKYGDPLNTLGFKDNELKAPGYLFDCTYWTEEPENRFPQLISKLSVDHEDWYFSSSKYGCYTNNPCLYKTDFLKANVLPFTFGEGVALEDDIFSWWGEQNFKIFQGPGLFEHIRLDRANTSIFRFALAVYHQIRQIVKFFGLRREHLEGIGLLKPKHK